MYEALDHLILSWARSHDLHVATEYKGAEVRSIEIVNSTGTRYQIWVDPPQDPGCTVVHARDFCERIKRFAVRDCDLVSAFEHAYSTVQDWMTKSGNRNAT